MAVASQDAFTAVDMRLVAMLDMLGFVHAQPAKALGPSGHQNCECC